MTRMRFVSFPRRRRCASLRVVRMLASVQKGLHFSGRHAWLSLRDFVISAWHFVVGKRNARRLYLEAAALALVRAAERSEASLESGRPIGLATCLTYGKYSQPPRCPQERRALRVCGRFLTERLDSPIPQDGPRGGRADEPSTLGASMRRGRVTR